MRATRLSLLAFSSSLLPFFPTRRCIESNNPNGERNLSPTTLVPLLGSIFANHDFSFENFRDNRRVILRITSFVDIPWYEYSLEGFPAMSEREREKRGDCGKVERKCLGAELPCSSVSIVLSARTAIRLISQDPAGNLCTLVQGLEQNERGTTLENFIVSDEYSEGKLERADKIQIAT